MCAIKAVLAVAWERQGTARRDLWLELQPQKPQGMDTAAGAAPLWRQEEEEANPAAVSVGAVQVWGTP